MALAYEERVCARGAGGRRQSWTPHSAIRGWTHELDGTERLPGPNVLDEEAPLGLALPLVGALGLEAAFEATLALDRALRDDLDELPLLLVGKVVGQAARRLALAGVELERALQAARRSNRVRRRERGIVDAERGEGRGEGGRALEGRQVEVMRGLQGRICEA